MGAASHRSYRRSGVIARRAAVLLSGTAAIALSLSQPASAISINNGVAPTIDSTNEYPNVGAVIVGGGTCTGTLINSRTVLTAAHCFFDDQTGAWIGPTPTNPFIPKVSFASTNALNDPTAVSVSSIGWHRNFSLASYGNDIAVISLARPITAVAR
jgi:subtilase-type serine protease